jgi:hypothetical protein
MAVFGEIPFVLISQARSSFGGIIPHVVVQEVYRDSLIVTDHPVEKGAPVTDHTFKRPTTLEMVCGFSDSSAGQEGFIESVYMAMLNLQGSRRPFDVTTPRRLYRNMLMSELSVTRDERSNSVLACSVLLREIILTSTQTTSASADNASQALPADTASPVESGSKQGITDTSFAGGFSTAGLNVSAGAGVPSVAGTEFGQGSFAPGNFSVL